MKKVHLANLNRKRQGFDLPNDKTVYFYKPFCGLDIEKSGSPLSEVASISATISEVTCLRCLRFIINHATKARNAILEAAENQPPAPPSLIEN